jgi:putative MFS transporter
MKTGAQIVEDLPWRWSVQGRIFVIGGLGYMFDAWDVTLNGFLTPLLGKDFGLTTGERGLVATFNLIGMAVGAVAWGTVADRLGRKKAFSVTLLIFGLFSLLGALSPNYEVFLALRFLAGIGLGGCIPVDYALVSEFSPARVRGRILSAMDLWWPIGGTLCGVSATWLAPVPGNWRWMLGLTVVPALLVVWVRRGIPESPLYLAKTGREAEARAIIDDMVASTGATPQPYAISGPVTGRRGPAPLAAVEQLRRVWAYSPRITSVAWLLFVTVLAVYYVALTWMPSILTAHGYSTYAAFSKTTVMSAVGVVGVLCSAYLVEVVGRKRVIGIAAPLATLALVIFSLVLKFPTAAVVWIAVFGFLIQFAIPVLYAYVSELYPTTIRASGFGWASAASRVFSGFIPAVFGSLLWPALGLPLTFTVLAAAVVVAVLWMAVAAPETKGRPLDGLDEPAERAERAAVLTAQADPVV